MTIMARSMTPGRYGTGAVPEGLNLETKPQGREWER